MSPIYCQHIIDSVSSQLNQLYMKFLKRNPGYSGKVSLYGHSLGSVLTYDILCHQESLSAPFPADFFNLEVSSDEGQVGKAPNTTAVHDFDVKDHDTSSTSGHSCADNVNGVNEDSTTVDCSLTDKIASPCVLENVPNNDDTLASPIAVDGVQNEVENQDETHQMACTGEGATSAVSTKDAECVSRSAVELHEDVSDKEKSISALEEEVRRLKAKLAELERHNDLTGSISDVESHEVSLASGRLNMGQGSTSQPYRPRIRYTKLNFKVDTFFAVGSPLGVFLCLRNVRLGVGM